MGVFAVYLTSLLVFKIGYPCPWCLASVSLPGREVKLWGRLRQHAKMLDTLNPSATPAFLTGWVENTYTVHSLRTAILTIEVNLD